MDDVLERIAKCVENGEVDRDSQVLEETSGQDGADEIAAAALKDMTPPGVLLEGCMLGMRRIGARFGRNEVYLPDLLMAAQAMNAVMRHLEPHFKAGSVEMKGVLVIGTVAGDLHDIGKNLVGMVVRGAGWDVIDLGVDVPTEKYLQAVREHPGSVVALSALLTTTMVNMGKTVKEIKANFPTTRVIVGGAPLTNDFARSIGADAYAPDPQGAVAFLA